MKTYEQLTERKKELNCIYRVDKLIEENLDNHSFLLATCGIIIDGFQFPCYTSVIIEYDGMIVKSPYFREGKDKLSTEIKYQNTIKGKIDVFYHGELTKTPFLAEEQHLIDSVGKRVSDYLFIASKDSESNNNNNELNSQIKTRQKILNDAVENADFAKLGIYSIYLIGSVKNHNCSTSSDIDLIVYYDGNDFSREKTEIWFKAWGRSILSSNVYGSDIDCIDYIFDLHFITDRDIEKGSSYAIMINSINNSARLVKTIL